MSTTIRPEVSFRNKYHIEKHRYYELKHFCLQYSLWKKLYNSLDSILKNPQAQIPKLSKTNLITDTTAECASAKIFYSTRIEMLENAATETDTELASYILKAVTQGYSYNYLKTVLGIPCCKEVYYNLYRRFFWLLDKKRG